MTKIAFKTMFRSLALAAVAVTTIAYAPAANAADPIKLKMAEVVRSQFYIPMYAAFGKGFVKEEGLEVEMVTANGGDRTGALVLSGQADFGLAGPEVPIYIYNGESSDKTLIFSALTATDGLFIGSREKIENFKWSMMEGKKIMGWRPGSTPELYLEYVLKKNGVSAETVKSIITNIGPAARDGAWLSGAADFAIFNEPNLTKLEKAGKVHFVASVGKEVGRADYTLFFAKKSWLEKNPEAAQKWTNAMAKGIAWTKTASTADIADAIASFFPGVTKEENMTVVDRYRTVGVPIWSSSVIADVAGIAKAQEIMVDGGVLPADKKVPYEKLVVPTFAEKAVKNIPGQ